jgi:hypothetical protein
MATEEEWGCLRKRRYRSRKKAVDVARRAQVRVGRMRAYRCPFGTETHYHVGHHWSDVDTVEVSSTSVPSTSPR